MHAWFHEAKLVSSTMERKTGTIYCNLKHRLQSKSQFLLALKVCSDLLAFLQFFRIIHSLGSVIHSVLVTLCETSHIPVVYNIGGKHSDGWLPAQN